MKTKKDWTGNEFSLEKEESLKLIDFYEILILIFFAFFAFSISKQKNMLNLVLP